MAVLSNAPVTSPGRSPPRVPGCSNTALLPRHSAACLSLAERANTVQGACRQPPSRSPLLRPSRPVRRRAVPCRTTLRRQACCLEVLWACALHGPTCKPLHQAPARPQLQADRLHRWGSLMTGSWRCGMPAGDGNHPRPLLLCMSEARGQPEVLSHCGHEHLLLHRR